MMNSAGSRRRHGLLWTKSLRTRCCWQSRPACRRQWYRGMRIAPLLRRLCRGLRDLGSSNGPFLPFVRRSWQHRLHGNVSFAFKRSPSAFENEDASLEKWRFFVTGAAFHSNTRKTPLMVQKAARLGQFYVKPKILDRKWRFSVEKWWFYRARASLDAYLLRSMYT